MKNILKRIFKGLAFLLPVLILIPSVALATPGYGAEITDCIVWREGQGARMPIHCKAKYESSRRIYELELAVDKLIAQNTQLQSQINGMQGVTGGNVQTVQTMDWTTLQRILTLEAQVKALSGQNVSREIPGCDKRTTGFSVTTGQSCLGNIPAKR